MDFCKKWLRNHPKFLLHFLIHIDVLMLCRKFESIPTSIFQVTTLLKNKAIFEKYPTPWFFDKWLQNHPSDFNFLSYDNFQCQFLKILLC